jgi:polyhydroxybutyrate depolymerase
VNGCTRFNDSETKTYTLRRYTDCRNHGDVEAYVVKHNGHAWPGGTKPRGLADEPAKEFSANEVIWEFFSRHPRQHKP